MGFATLYDAALDVLETSDPIGKADLGYAAAKAWFAGALATGPGEGGRRLPDRPARPAQPVLLAPRDMPKRSSRRG